jgi:hypothetical protein
MPGAGMMDVFRQSHIKGGVSVITIILVVKWRRMEEDVISKDKDVIGLSTDRWESAPRE